MAKSSQKWLKVADDACSFFDGRHRADQGRLWHLWEVTAAACRHNPPTCFGLQRQVGFGWGSVQCDFDDAAALLEASHVPMVMTCGDGVCLCCELGESMESPIFFAPVRPSSTPGSCHLEFVKFCQK